MVTYADFLSASPIAETWHVLIGLAVILLAIVLIRFSPMWGSVLAVAFIAFAFFKEFYIDIVLEGASVASGVVDVTFFLVGGVLGAVVGLLRGWWSVLALVGGLTLILGLLFAGVV